jgi:squalene-hopene/tetraprenyl-beta-curcumene cyclase
MNLKSLSSGPLISATLAAAFGCAIAVAPSATNTSTVHAADKPATPAPATWDRQAAARYLDSRQVWWQAWDRTQKDHGTYCISCHTQAMYALARPTLRQDLAEAPATGAERAMIDSVEKRVHLWSQSATSQVQPFYDDEKYGQGKEIESRNAESVLNAVILSSYDQRQGHLSPNTRLAFDNAWTLQSATGPDAGAWVWQNFNYTPWESPEAQYHWAALFAVTVANTPDHYRDDAAIASHLTLLTSYLSSHYAAQPLLNKVVALWAARSHPSLLTADQRSTLIADVLRLQHKDGGWSASDLGDWERRDKTPLEYRPDGYATGLITLVLEESAAPQTDASIARGRAWLIANQDKTTGGWTAWSLNKNRDLDSPIGKFMSDAATSYAVLALENNPRPR